MGLCLFISLSIPLLLCSVFSSFPSFFLCFCPSSYNSNFFLSFFNNSASFVYFFSLHYFIFVLLFLIQPCNIFLHCIYHCRTDIFLCITQLAQGNLPYPSYLLTVFLASALWKIFLIGCYKNFCSTSFMFGYYILNLFESKM